MRRILSLALLLPLALSGSACVSGPTPRQVLAVGFSTPEQTFASFQTAFSADLVNLEYRCFSSALKQSMGSQVFYRVERSKILAEQPFIKWAARAKVIASELSPDGRHCRLKVEINTLFLRRSFSVDLVQEAFYDVYDAEGVAEGAPASWPHIASTQVDRKTDEAHLIVRVPMPEGYELEELAGLHAGLVWKIDAFTPQ
jgi:hypothetical protein